MAAESNERGTVARPEARAARASRASWVLSSDITTEVVAGKRFDVGSLVMRCGCSMRCVDWWHSSMDMSSL